MLRQFVEWVESGKITCAGAVSHFLARISERDPEIRAWVEVAPREPRASGLLAGIPFGAKDIFETCGMATEYGSALFAGRRGGRDAAIVAYLERRGAILLGKTTTAAFAYFDPPATRNPRDPRRTPGGSSSGSAAAVAAGMAPFALGTQTQGSVIRPAAFCGIAGFKPTFGRLPLDGVLPFAPSLDTAGLFTATAADMQCLWARSAWGEVADAPPAVAAWLAPHRPPAALARLRAAGWRIDLVDPPREYQELLAAVRIINDYEGARTHRELAARHGAAIGKRLFDMVQAGLAIPAERYVEALECVKIGKQKMTDLFRDYPVAFTPSAPGPAPLGLEWTGDPRMNAPWTGLGFPAITVPLPRVAPPRGLQITAASGADDLLLAAAVEVESCWTR